MWLTLTVWIIVVPTLEEGSVHDRKTASSDLSLNPHLDRVAGVGLEVIEAYMGVMAIEITSTSVT